MQFQVFFFVVYRKLDALCPETLSTKPALFSTCINNEKNLPFNCVFTLILHQTFIRQFFLVSGLFHLKKPEGAGAVVPSKAAQTYISCYICQPLIFVLKNFKINKYLRILTYLSDLTLLAFYSNLNQSST